MKHVVAALLLLLALGSPALAQALELHFIALDTHGESILVRTPQGRTVLIDGGLPQGGPQVAAYLRAQGVTSLDLVVATHDDPDHFGGLPLVLEEVPARAFWESPSRAHGYRRLLRAPLEQALAQRRVPRTEVTRGARLELEEGVLLEVLAPSAPFFTTARKDDPNGDSLVLRLTHTTATGSTRVLLCGDATRATEARLLASGEELRCDLLKVPHHGIDTASTADFLAATHASAAVICCAPGSGLPDEAVVARLSAAGLGWYRTDANGTVVVRSTGDPAALAFAPARGAASDDDATPFPGVGTLVRRYAKLPRFTPPPGAYAGKVGARVYHRQACVARRLISRGRVVTFASEDEAREAGRAPCALCRP